ncbi:lipocalin family protein [Pedobacter sp.]|uniref:lipocalin family protein n=1 Tax=Pedobacter sp. TaxID=1411316 RepID=UPI003D7F3024
MNDIELEQLKRKWTHSFEEDNDQEQVFRPSGFAFNRSRGRNQFDLKENGEVSGFQPGRNDVPEEITGSWHVDGDILVIDFHDGNEQIFPIKEINEEKLVVKK